MQGEPVAAHVHRVHADMDEQLGAVGQGQAAGVAGLGHDDRDGRVCRGVDGVAGRLKGHALAHDALREHLVGHVGERDGASIRDGTQRDSIFFCGCSNHGRGLGCLRCCRGRSGACRVRRAARHGQAAVLTAELAAADEQGQHKGHDDGNRHGQQEVEPVFGVDGQDAGQAADTDRDGDDARADRDHGRTGRADHAADEREDILHIDTEQRRLGDAQIARDAGRDVDLLGALVASLQEDHAKDGRALRDVGQRDHGPEAGAVVGVDQLRVDGVCHVVQAGHDDGRIEQAKEGGEEQLDVGVQAHVDDVCDEITDLPADRADDGVCDKHGRHQRTEGHDDHADDFRADLLEELFQIDQDKAGHDGGDDLSLIADHLHLGKAEVPDRDIFRGRRGDREAV